MRICNGMEVEALVIGVEEVVIGVVVVLGVVILAVVE